MADDESSESPGSQTERFTLRQLVLAAVALALLGTILLFGTIKDAVLTPSDEPTASTSNDGNDDHTDDEPEPTQERTNSSPSSPTADSGTGAPTPDDESPELPPGIEREGPTQAPDPGTIDDRSATDVALAAVTAVYSLDTATDDEPEDGMLRAEPWLQQSFDDDAYDLESFANMIGDDWEAWAEHGGYAAINTIQDVISNDAVTPEERGDTATEAVRRIMVSFTPLGRDGWNGSVSEHTWYVHVGRGAKSEPWQITEMRRPFVDPTNQPLPTSSPT